MKLADQPPTPFTRREFLQVSGGLAAFAAAGAASAAPQAPSDLPPHPALFLPPHLSCPTETSIRISAYNDQQPAEAFVEVRSEGAAEWERRGSVLTAGAYELLDWKLRGLAAATRYQYRVVTKQGSDKSLRDAASGSFVTQRNRPASYTALLLTDPHTGSFPPGSGPARTLDRVVQNAAQAKADFMLELGDTVAWPGSREFAQKDRNGALSALAQYRRQIGPLTSQVPLFGVIGNWAGESGKFPEDSIERVAGVRHALLPNPNHRTYAQGGSEREDYYAFAWGDVLYIILNIQTYSKPSEPGRMASLMADVSRVEDWTLGEKQLAWFETTLAKSTERFRFVCVHHPAGGNGGDALNTLYGRGGGRAWNVGEQARIHQLMKKHKVQVFFYGHDHVFVDDVVDGIHYTLPGSCGAPWKFTRQETGYDRFWPDSGHAQLDVTPEQATVSFINLEGKVLHRFTVPCA